MKTALARLIGIAVRPRKGGPMQILETARISVDEGLHGDKRSRPGRRQVTLMSRAAWDEVCRELGDQLPWTTRRANLLVDELPLHHTAGYRIRIGEVELEITGETDPCAKMEAARPGLFDALKPHWRGGVTCRVRRGGELLLGEEVHLLAPYDD